MTQPPSQLAIYGAVANRAAADCDVCTAALLELDKQRLPHFSAAVSPPSLELDVIACVQLPEKTHSLDAHPHTRY